MSTIPQTAIDWLRNDPSAAARAVFDEEYGDGQAATVLGEQNKPVSLNSPEKAASGIWGVARSVYDDVSEGISDSFVAVPTAAFEGSVVDPANFLASVFGDVRFNYEGDKPWIEYIPPSEVKDRQDDEIFNVITDRVREEYRDTVTASVLAEGTQWGVAFLGLGKIFKPLTMAGRVAQAAGATFLSREGDEGRLADALIDVGVPEEYVPDFLESDPNDPDVVGRLKNTLEDTGLGLLADYAARAVMAFRRGNPEEVAEIVEEVQVLKEKTEERLAVQVADEIPEILKDPDLDILGYKAVPESPAPSQTRGPRPEVDESFDPGKPKRRFGLTPEQHRDYQNMAYLFRAFPERDVTTGAAWQNLDDVITPQAVEARLLAARSVLEHEFRNAPQNVGRWTSDAKRQARRYARMLGVDEDKVLKELEGVKDVNRMAADMLARVDLATALTEDLERLVDALHRYRMTGNFKHIEDAKYRSEDELRLAILHRTEIAANIQAQAEGIISNSARTMRAMQVVRSGDPSIRQMLREANTQNFLSNADNVVDSVMRNRGKRKAGKRSTGRDRNPDKVATTLRDATREAGLMKRTGDVINTYRINAMLSGPGTQEVNFISNMMQMVGIPTQELLGAAVTLNRAQALHAVRTYRGIIGSLWEALRTAKVAFYNDEAILDPFTSKIDIEQFKPQTAIGKAVQMPSRFLLGADEIFKQASYRGRIFADAMTEADLKGLTGARRQQEIEQYIRDSFTESGAATRGEALLQAQRTTFTEPLTGDFSRSIQRLAARNFLVRFIIPFVRTPLNILSQGFQHAPALGLLSKRMREDLMAGGARAAQARGKQILGTAMFGMAFLGAFQGRFTGSGPIDPKQRAVWSETHRPYSIKTVNPDGTIDWQPYDRMEPFAFVLGATADLVEVYKYADDVSRFEFEEAAKAVFMAFAENSVNKTFTQGIHDFMTIMVDDDPQKTSRVINSMAGSFVPNAIPQVLNQEEKREVRSVIDEVRSRVGMDDTMDRKRNALGEPRLNFGAKWDPLTWIEDDTRERDIVLEEMNEIAQRTKSFWRSERHRVGEISLKELKYQDDQSLYDRWMELKSTIEIGGKTLRERLEETIKSDYYQRLQYGVRDSDSPRKDILNKIIRRYRNRAESVLLRESDLFKEVYREKRRLEREVRRPRLQLET